MSGMGRVDLSEYKEWLNWDDDETDEMDGESSLGEAEEDDPIIEPVKDLKNHLEDLLYHVIKGNGMQILENIVDARECILDNLYESRAVNTVLKLCIEEEIFLDFSKKIGKGSRLEKIVDELTEEIISYGFSGEIAKEVASAFVSAANHYHTYQIGKSTCRQLKEMRKMFAKINGIDFYEKECTFDGPCQGTCPYCDAKTKELLEKAASLQNEVVYPKTEVIRKQREEIKPVPMMGTPAPDYPGDREIIADGESNDVFDTGDGNCDWNIDELELSVRAYNCLERAGIYKVSQLTKLTYEDLIEIRNIGRGTFEEISRKLRELGLSLRCDD